MSDINKLPYIHANNCQGCQMCCGEPCPLDFLNPLACGEKCSDAHCYAPNQVIHAGDLVGLDANNKLTAWGVGVGFTALQFVGLAAHTVVTDTDGNVINRRILNSFAPQCTGCQGIVWILGTFDERDISKQNKQLLEDAITAGHVRRRLNRIIL